VHWIDIIGEKRFIIDKNEDENYLIAATVAVELGAES